MKLNIYEVLNLKTKELTLEAKLALLQNPPQQIEIPASIPIEILQIADGNLKKEYLEKLKQIILEEEDKTPKFSLDGSSSSLTQFTNNFITNRR